MSGVISSGQCIVCQGSVDEVQQLLVVQSNDLQGVMCDVGEFVYVCNWFEANDYVQLSAVSYVINSSCHVGKMYHSGSLWDSLSTPNFLVCVLVNCIHHYMQKG